MTQKTIGIIGLGYIGLPTAAVVASSGFDVIGVDVNQAAIDTINSGGVHIFEPGLEDVVKDVVQKQKFKAVLTPEKADIFLIAVPTPFIEENKEADLRYVDQAAKALAPVLEAGNLVVLESTSPIGTTARITRIMADLRPDLTFPNDAQEGSDIMVAYCPERVLPGKVLHELRHNDRIIGGLNTASGDAAAAFYQAITSGQCLKSTAETAEMSKLTENAFRDVNIAFANELSVICDKLDIDVWKLIDLVNCHPRVNVLQPGAGVGGHCIAIDPWFIVQAAPDEARMIRTAREVNDHKPEWVVDQVITRVADDPSAKIACFGLAFKPDIDDLRESPSLAIAANIARKHAGEILVVEPFITELPPELQHSNCRLVTAQEALEAANVATFLVRHSAFADLAIPTGTSVLDVCGNFKTATGA